MVALTGVIVPISLWVVGLFTVAQVLKPRLPKYSFQIKRIMPKWITDRGLYARLGSKVKMHNDNYVPIDIHALSFDLFYHDWNGHLDHIGQVTDVTQLHCKECKNEEEKQSSALWALLPRQSFETLDDVVMKPSGGFNVMSSLTWNIFKSGGIVHLPSSGVIHMKANKKIPMTLSMLCDNALDAWTLEVQGLSCSLDNLELGWSDLSVAVDKMRSKIVKPPTSASNDYDNNVVVVEMEEIQYQLPATLLPDEMHDDDDDKRIEWDDVLPLLSHGW